MKNFISFQKSVGFSHESCSLAFEEDAPVTIKSILELPLNSSLGVTGTVMTNSMTSSLASPVDSGFTQLDSETDTASFSEVLLDADSASMKEVHKIFFSEMSSKFLIILQYVSDYKLNYFPC